MANPNAITERSDEGLILKTDDERDLYQTTNPLVQAVIYRPPSLPSWLDELAVAVRTGQFQVPRTVVPCASRNQIEDWLENNLPARDVAPDLRDAVKTDILALVDRVAVISGASRFMLRILTAVPNKECGFHLDTVPPGANPWGLLRVYTGEGTEYVEPSNVTSMADFYRYLSRRERLSRERAVARGDGDLDAYERLEREIEQLDSERAFLRRPHDVHIAPAGSIVEFRHVDISLHWSNHAKSLAWIHSSPMAGEARFLINVSPDEPPSSRRRRDKRATARQSSDLQTAGV